MPSGKFHRKRWEEMRTFTLVVVVILLFLSLFYDAYLWLIALGLFFGYELGAFVEPDLDHRNITYSEYMVMRKMGCLGSLWVAFWTPYGYLIPHRSFLSHSIIVGTFIRFLYLFIIPAILIVWLGGIEIIQDVRLFSFMGGAFTGLVISDFVHIWFDWLKGSEK